VVIDQRTGRRVDGADFVFAAGPAASKPFRDRYAGRPGPRAVPAARPKEQKTEPKAKDDPRIQRILSRVRRIPEGRVQTYGDIDHDAPRLVGRALHNVDDGVRGIASFARMDRCHWVKPNASCCVKNKYR